MPCRRRVESGARRGGRRRRPSRRPASRKEKLKKNKNETSQATFHENFSDREQKKTHKIPESNFAPLVSGGHQQRAGAGVEGGGEDSVLHHFGHALLGQLHALQG